MSHRHRQRNSNVYAQVCEARQRNLGRRASYIFELRTRLDGNSIRQYYCWCRVSLRDIFSKPSRTHFCPCSYDATITRALFLIDMNDFNGTNSVTTLNFQYSQFLPLDGAMDTSSQRFFSVLDSDKNLVFFEVNPSM